MSKIYMVDMKIDISKLNPNGGILMKKVAKEEDKSIVDHQFDSRGFKEQTGPEIFEMICSAAIQNANPTCSYIQLQGFRKTLNLLKYSIESGEFQANKTEIDIIKNSLKGNPSWPNNDELMSVIDSIIANLDGAEQCE